MCRIDTINLDIGPEAAAKSAGEFLAGAGERHTSGSMRSVVGRLRQVGGRCRDRGGRLVLERLQDRLAVVVRAGQQQDALLGLRATGRGSA